MKKTHKGRTALQLLQGAEVGLNGAGMALVWIGDFQCFADEHGHLVMKTADETIHLECGTRAKARLEALIAEAEAMDLLIELGPYYLDLTEA